jgi:type II secretory pathway pseudopilin PulG
MMRRSGVTLVEVILAATLLAIALVAIGLSLSHSVRSSSYARGLQVARQAAAELSERMRAQPGSTVYEDFWSDEDLTTEDLDGATWVTGGDPGLVFDLVRASTLDPAVQRGMIGLPASGPALAIRFLDEDEFATAVGGTIDLDGDGAVGASVGAPQSGGAGPDFSYYPVLVRVAWLGENGQQSHTLLTVVAADLEVDPAR